MFKVAIIGGGKLGSLFHALMPGSTIITRQTFSTTRWDDFDTILFAIKPQDFKMLSPLPLASKLIISVMAGITMEQLTALTGSQQVIRCMPNTAIQVNSGLTVWCKTTAVTATQTDWFVDTLSSKTKLLPVDNDDWLDRSTAISGCGPAYVFAFTEALLEAANALGFNPEQAELLVTETLMGSVALLKQSGQSAATLRQQVTSKGGATLAALEVVAAAEFNNLWKQATQAAYAKTKALAN